MPRTPKTTKKPAPAPAAPVAAPAPGEVLTLAEAAAYLRLPEEEVLRMAREQGLPVRQVGSEWRFLKAAIQQWLATGSPPPKSGNEGIWAAAGSWKDDPYAEEMLREIYRGRAHPSARSIHPPPSTRLPS